MISSNFCKLIQLIHFYTSLDHHKPKVTTSPRNGYGNEFQKMTLRCVKNSNVDVTYSWKKGNAIVSGENKQTLEKSYLEMSDEGSYRCITTSVSGSFSMTSDAVNVRVRCKYYSIFSWFI